jgi:RNA polymerase sigma-70 factor, ECF subfamily
MSDARTQALQSFEGSLRAFIARRVRESEIDDVLQDTFMRLQRGVRELRDAQRLEAWVYRVARSAIVDQYRARERHAFAEDAKVVAQPVDDDEPQAERELAGCVVRFMAELAATYREALALTELQGLTQREAAERLGVSLSGMKSRVQRGRAKLREAFDACCDIARDGRGRVIDYVPRAPAKPKGCCD